MRTFLWFMLIVMVSGDRQSVDVTTFVNEDVLLPCSCTNREKISIPRWQTEGNLAELVWFDNKVTNYTGRVETFFNSNINNCSILLKNVTKNDHKKYSCRFTQKTYRYQCNFVNLRVCGPEPCQQNFTKPNGVRVSMCDVKSRSNTTELQWTLDGEPLENSTEYKISSSSTLTDGIYHVISTLEMNSTETNSSSVIKCIVSATRFAPDRRTSPDNPKSMTAMFIGLALLVGLIMLVVFIFLRKMNSSQTDPNCCRDVEKTCILKTASSEGDQKEKQLMPVEVI